jgi:DNA helicase-2/ATP-dependent DNA helicase PcrA
LALRLKLNSQDILHKEQLLKALKLQFEHNLSLKDIVERLENGIEEDILQIALNLNDDGSNMKSLFETFKKEKEKIELDSDEKKKMLFDDIDELLEHWHNYATQTDNKSLHQFKNSMALGQTHSIKEHKDITLSTVHTMKGQEYDIVFLMGMDEGTFPDYRAKNNIELDQEKNNLYVAFTRAKRFLYVTYPKQRTMPWGGVKNKNISRFLKEF